MKLFLTLLLSFYFLGCAQDPRDSKVSSILTFNEPVFTITHKATTHEDVIIFLKEDGFDQKKLSSIKSSFTKSQHLKYIVKPSECLEITASQFDNLIVLIGVGAGSVHSGLSSRYVACGGLDEENKCQPQNSNIVDQGGFRDDFVMVPVEAANPTGCVAIEEWMDSKNPKTPEPIDTQNTEQETTA